MHLELLSSEAFSAQNVANRPLSFSGGALPGPAGEAYIAPPDPLPGLRGDTPMERGKFASS